MKKPFILFVILAMASTGAWMAVQALQVQPGDVGSGAKKLPDRLESWYQVLQGDEHIGFVHSIIKVRGIGEGYNFTHEEDVEIKVDKKYVPVSGKLEGQIDADFQPRRLEGSYSYSGARVGVQITTENDERKIRLTPPGGKTPIVLSGGRAKDVSIDLGSTILQLQQTQGLREGQRIQLRLMNVGQGQLQVVTLIVEAQVEREYMGKKSRVYQIGVEGYQAQTRELAIQTLYVDSFGRVVESVGGVRVLLVKDGKKARGKSARVGQRVGNDPFAKEPRLEEKIDLGEPTTEPPEDTVDFVEPEPGEEFKMLTEIRRIVDEMKKHAQEDLETELREAYERLIARYKPLREKMPTERETLERLRLEAEGYYPGAKITYEEADGVFADIARLAQEGNCKEMESRLGKLERYRNRPELAYMPELEKLESELIADARRLVEVCNIREALRGKDLALTGAVHYHRQVRSPVQVGVEVLGHTLSVDRNVVLVHSEAYALINGKAYEVGDTVEGQDVKVERIDKTSVQVSYRGQVREVRMKTPESENP